MESDHTTFGSVEVDWENEPVPNMGRFESYEASRAGMEWDIPETFNLASDVVTTHADGSEEVALIQRIEGEGDQEQTFEDFERRSNELANWASGARTESLLSDPDATG